MKNDTLLRFVEFFSAMKLKDKQCLWHNNTGLDNPWPTDDGLEILLVESGHKPCQQEQFKMI